MNQGRVMNARFSDTYSPALHATADTSRPLFEHRRSTAPCHIGSESHLAI
jgi:hypothetical protein